MPVEATALPSQFAVAVRSAGAEPELVPGTSLPDDPEFLLEFSHTGGSPLSLIVRHPELVRAGVIGAHAELEQVETPSGIQQIRLTIDRDDVVNFSIYRASPVGFEPLAFAEMARGPWTEALLHGVLIATAGLLGGAVLWARHRPAG